MEALSTKTLELRKNENGVHSHKLYYGNYAEYLEQALCEDAPASARNTAAPPHKAYAVSTANDIRLAQKEAARKKRKIERLQEAAENEISRLEAERGVLESKLLQPEVYSDYEKARVLQKNIDELNIKINAAYSEWEKIV